VTIRHLLLLGCAGALLAGCGGRRPPLPAISGALPAAIIEASLAGEDGPAAGPLLIDSIAFGRLGVLLGGSAWSAADLVNQLGRQATLADPMDVLECPRREPCRLREDGSFITVWDAVRTGDDLELVVSRTYNVERLYTMTTAVTHRLRLLREAGGWRLTSRERLPT
jgi:hypothetical protein